MSQELSHEKMLEIIVKALDDKKAEDIRVIKVRDLTIITDYFVIAGASSNTQTRALADEVEFQLKEQAQTAPAQVQGNNGSNWIILDYHDVIVHVFHNEQREFYSLERLWSDGEEIDISKWTK